MTQPSVSQLCHLHGLDNIGKNCVAHFLVSIGYAFVLMKKHVLF